MIAPRARTLAMPVVVRARKHADDWLFLLELLAISS
jgi:hypothetical protein